MEQKKKVLFLITKSNFGGAQRYVLDLSTNLPKEQFEVAVAVGGTGILIDKLQQAGIRVITIPELQRDISLRKELQSFRSIRKIIKKERPDILHVNSSKAGGIGALAGRIERVPRIVFTAHGWPFKEERSILWRTAIYILSWCTAVLSHGVICVSENDLAYTKRMPLVAKKSVRIYNGIALPTLGTGDRIRNAFPSGIHITGTIGELNDNKNQIALIEKAQQDPDMYVAIVGEGENRTHLEKKIAELKLTDQVKLFGFQPAEEVLNGFDSFAFPSRKEGLPYVLLEAKAAGLPIEANRVGGVGEILDRPIGDFSLHQMVAETIRLYTATHQQ